MTNDKKERENIGVKEAALLLGLGDRRIIQMINEGVLPASKHPFWKNRWVIRRQDAEELRALREF